MSESCNCNENCENQSIENSIISEFRVKYDYFTKEEVQSIYERALNTWLDLTFPFDYNVTKIPADRPRAMYWIKDCMKEIIDRNGITATSYSENGLSIHWGTDMVSQTLMDRIVPMAAVRGKK